MDVKTLSHRNIIYLLVVSYSQCSIMHIRMWHLIEMIKICDQKKKKISTYKNRPTSNL